VVATGIDAEEALVPRPVTLSLVSDQNQQGAAQRVAAGGAVGGLAEAELEAESMPAPAEAQAASGLYAYSQAALQGVAVETAKTSTSVAETAVAERAVAVGAAQGAVAVAEPVGPGSDDNFIAPPPVEPEPTPAPEPQAAADPFAAAAMENGSRAPRSAGHAAAMGLERKKSSGLFAKMTDSAARALQAATLGGEQRNPAAAPASGAQAEAWASAEPRPGTEPNLRPPPEPNAQSSARPAAQPRLSGLDSAERGSGAILDEDLLDIPAFLRRQAN
jgi:cell division protein FtsZ